MNEATHNRRVSDSERRKNIVAVLSEKSYIQVGIAIAIATFLIGSIWWAATIQVKLDQVIEEIKIGRAATNQLIEHDTKIKILEMRIIQLEARKTGP